MLKNRFIQLVLALLIPMLSLGQSQEQSARSVVKIKTSYNGKDEKGNPALVVNTSTGWAWKDPRWIVTTLHSVAGVKEIEVCNVNNDCTGAEIMKVLKVADLALIKLDRDLGLKPLNTETVSPQSSQTYQVWGYPHGVYSIQGDDIKFSRSLNQYPTLNDILTGNTLKQQLIDQGYPLPNAKIFRISSIIQPGHSGAPILTSSGKVIGIADGGLRGGTARINWAMPSETYLKSLLTSSETAPGSISLQQNLYSHSYYIPITTSANEVDSYIIREEAKTTVSSNNGTEVHKTWTASLDDIYQTLDYEDQNSIDEMLEDGLNDFLNNAYFDIYEDYNTGASFAVPYGANVVYEDDLFHAIMDHSYFAFAPFNANSFDEAGQGLNAFVEGMLQQYPQSLEAENFDGDYEIDEYEEYMYRVDFREIYDDGQYYLMIVGGEVMGSDLACLVVICPLPREMNEEQMIEFLQLAIASEVISFSGH